VRKRSLTLRELSERERLERSWSAGRPGGEESRQSAPKRKNELAPNSDSPSRADSERSEDYTNKRWRIHRRDRLSTTKLA